MKTNRTLIAMCVATLFASGSLCAKDKWEYHTDGWEKTKSYGNVMVAGDSANQWGPWEEFVQPAAGAPSIAFLGAGEGDPYNVLPNPIPPNPEVGCLSGEWCGYIAAQLMEKYEYWKKGRKHSEWRPVGDAVGGEIALAFQPTDGPWPWGGPLNEGAVNLRMLTGYEAGSETGMVPAKFGSGWYWDEGHQGYFNMIGSMHLDENFQLIELKGGSDGYNWHTHSWVNDYATMGVMEAYIYGEDESKMKVYAPFVAGQVTASGDMPGNVTAMYRGETALAGGDVCMRVNFGTAQWSGTFNGGHGSNGFRVEGGTLSGASFSASTGNLSAWGSDVSGSVKGSFYGPQAAAAGGLIDVTKTSSYSENARTYSSPAPTRYVDVFLANKVSQTPNYRSE